MFYLFSGDQNLACYGQRHTEKQSCHGQND
jgi:hypothetical protein